MMWSPGVRSASLLAIAVAGILGIAAPAQAAASDDDACASQRAAASMMNAVTHVRSWRSGRARGCRFFSRDGSSAAVAITRETSVNAARTAYARELAISAGNSRGRALRIDRLGDMAAVVDGVLYVRRGTLLFAFSAVRRHRDAGDARLAERFARIVLEPASRGTPSGRR